LSLEQNNCFYSETIWEDEKSLNFNAWVMGKKVTLFFGGVGKKETSFS